MPDASRGKSEEMMKGEKDEEHEEQKQEQKQR